MNSRPTAPLGRGRRTIRNCSSAIRSRCPAIARLRRRWSHSQLRPPAGHFRSQVIHLRNSNGISPAAACSAARSTRPICNRSWPAGSCGRTIWCGPTECRPGFRPANCRGCSNRSAARQPPVRSTSGRPSGATRQTACRIVCAARRRPRPLGDFHRHRVLCLRRSRRDRRHVAVAAGGAHR